MSDKTLAVLLIILAALIALYFWAVCTRPETSPFRIEIIFTPYQATTEPSP